jgi:hypothetical protein
MIADRLDNDIRPGKLLAGKQYASLKAFTDFSFPRDGLDEGDLTVANVNILVSVFPGAS